MKITSIELENIKSYRRQTIELTDGVNAISGHNGSGKTTILEAIGFALFDYLPYPQSSFLREGEKTGTVRVRLQLNDAREYEVVRKVGAGAMYHVTDVESGVRLADQNKGVQDWLRQTAFDLEGEADLEALFKNAVGVPQGLMTSDFIGTPRTRKAIFDPLLRVEEYEKAWSELLQTGNNIRDRIGIVREEIARLETDVERIPELSAQRDDAAGQFDASAAALAAVEAELVDVEARKSALDALQAEIAALAAQHRDCAAQVQHLGDMVQVHRASVGMAEEAGEIVRATQEGHRKYEEARRALMGLEVQRTERDAQQKLADTATSDMKATKRALDDRDAERAAAIADGKAAAALQPDVERQAGLEAQLQDAQMRAREAQRLEADLARINREVAALELGMATREKQVEAARAAGVEAGRLDSVMAQHRDVVARLATLAPARDQLRELEAEGKRLRTQHDELEADVGRLHAFRAEIAEREPVAAGRKDMEGRERELREERIRSQATLDYQEVARADLRGASCPLLELQCPVVHADASILTRFDRRVGELSERIGILDAELAVLGPQLAAATSAAERVQWLAVEVAKLEGSERQLPGVRKELEECRARYGEVSNVLAGERALQAESQRLQLETTRLQAAAAEGGRLGLLQEQQARDADGLTARKTDRERIARELADRTAARVEVERINGELRAMNDPRGRQQRLQARAIRLAEIEDALERLQAHLQDASDRLRAAVGELSRYEGLDAHIAEQHVIEQQHDEDHRLYLQNIEEAGQLEARRAELRAAQEQLAVATAAEGEMRAALEDVQARYDADEHERLRARHRDVVEQLGTARSNHEHLRSALDSAERELARVRLQEERLARKVEERTDLESAAAAVKFIRQTIKDAGPAVTETLLQNISAIANDIYAEIMDDHAVELRWDRDYEVLVRRGPDDRKFAQLSGGEQMSAALAVRLALLREMSAVDMAFFDEPTQNMDADRRVNLAGQIRDIRGFNQLIVISHDDTFEHHTDNLVRLRKDEDETVVEV